VLEDSGIREAVEWAASHGATYADARAVERESETVSVKDGQIEGVDRDAPGLTAWGDGTPWGA